jgi:hypothetical protein
MKKKCSLEAKKLKLWKNKRLIIVICIHLLIHYNSSKYVIFNILIIIK